MAKALYVHIPFCDSICGYCDFAKVLNQPKLVDEYLKVLEKEVLSKDLSNIESIYIGGGTPSALNLKQLEILFEILKPYSNNLIEYTVEINPESLTLDKAKLFVEYGINRTSVGMQVTQKHLLDLIDRKHDLNKTKEAVTYLNEVGINNISIDLMYGIPTQTLSNLQESLREIIKLNITHISLYALTIEPNTKFYHLNYKPANSELDADMYELAVDYLANNDFNRYEISNFAKVGYESFHNQVYWNYKDFVGVGLHASSKINNQRITNTRNLKKYLNHDFDQEVINLSKDDLMFEYIMMNLRLSKGFSINEFNSLYSSDFKVKYNKQIKKLVNDKLLEVEDDRVYATASGLGLLFNVLEEFME